MRQSVFIGDTSRPSLILGFARNTRVNTGQPTRIWISAKNLDPEHSVSFNINKITETGAALAANDVLTMSSANITIREDETGYSPAGVIEFNTDFGVGTSSLIQLVSIVPHGLVEATYAVDTKWLEIKTAGGSSSGRVMLDIASPVDLFVYGVGRANRVD